MRIWSLIEATPCSVNCARMDGVPISAWQCASLRMVQGTAAAAWSWLAWGLRRPRSAPAIAVLPTRSHVALGGTQAGAQRMHLDDTLTCNHVRAFPPHSWVTIPAVALFRRSLDTQEPASRRRERPSCSSVSRPTSELRAAPALGLAQVQSAAGRLRSRQMPRPRSGGIIIIQMYNEY